MKVKVNIRSKQTLPRYTDEQLTWLAERIGLTLGLLKELHSEANQTYQAIGADLGGGDRETIVQCVLDCDYILNAYRLSDNLKTWLKSRRTLDYDLDHLYEAVAAGFPYPEYE